MANSSDQQCTGFEGADFTGHTTIGGTITTAAARTGTYGLNAAPVATAQYGATIGTTTTGTNKAGWFQFFFQNIGYLCTI